MTKLLNREKGFTLIEAVLAMLVLVIGAIAIWSMVIVGTRFNAESENKTAAVNIAQLKIEEIMSTPFRYVVAQHPPGETLFDSEDQEPPYWMVNAQETWIPSLQGGKYRISYPDGLDADPLRIKVAVSWDSNPYPESSLSLETILSMTPGRFR